MVKKYDGPALGLTRANTEDEIRQRVFEAIHDTGYMIFCTIGLDGVTPTNRGLEVHYLDDTGDLFIGLCPGKPVYRELKKNPRISGGLVVKVKSDSRLTYGIRLNAIAEEVFDEKIMARYWDLNRGTAALYRRALDNFTIFRLTQGEGEIMDVYENEPRPWHYEVGENCIGCGVCAEKCMTQVITVQDGRAVIDHPACLECGVCLKVCPAGAIIKNDWE